MSILEFNRRVLAYAQDTGIPLMERLRYLCISCTNLDEFFEVRVASMHARKEESGGNSAVIDTLLDRISVECHKIVEEQYDILNKHILPQLAEEKIRIIGHRERTEAQRAWVQSYFKEHIRPLLTPVVLDPAHPFPQTANKGLHFIVSLGGKDVFGRGSAIAIVKAPRVLPRIIQIPEELAGGEAAFCLLSSMIQANIASLFPQREILAYSQFRVTRDSDLWVDEEEVKNLREALQRSIYSRHYGAAVRLEISKDCPEELADLLLEQFSLGKQDLYRVNGPVNMGRLSAIFDYIKKTELFFLPYSPSTAIDVHNRSASFFDDLKKKDVLLHHPFQSFQTVVDFVQLAASDPQVIVIKQTVYRTGTTSELMEALISAAMQGKEVIAVVELKARFDEEQNIDWAERLERAGAQVVYGVMGLKTHAKLALAIRKEEEGLCYYAHLGTGNYHSGTSRVYTDFGLLTANQKIASEVNEVFIQLTSLTKSTRLQNLWLAPFSLHEGIIKAIENEAAIALQGKPARIIAKMNALIDETVIQALYMASSAGVKIDLIVRGACALKPGVPGLSENIRVRSIVGRFLEHTRIYYFRNNLKHDLYLSSADLMARNLFRRVEVAFPVLDKSLKKRIMDEGLQPYLKDNLNTWELLSDGTYRRRTPRTRNQLRYSAQQHLMKLYGAEAI